MSTETLKRLTIRAKKSLSGLNPFCDGSGTSNEIAHTSPTSNKENEAPGLEGLCGSPTYAASPDINTSPFPARDSPSRRKKLMGSLRRIRSLRNVRSSPIKERGKQYAGSPCSQRHAACESPCTPSSDLRPSPSLLALNFQQSPSDQPMFDILRRKDSASSSMLVHCSSPIPIPTLAKPEAPPCGAPAITSDLPDGTVPKSPTPLQMALERDIDQFARSTESSPASRQAGMTAEPMPTPMPGTNIGIDDDDIISVVSSKDNSVSLPERAAYFGCLVEVEGPERFLKDKYLPKKQGPMLEYPRISPNNFDWEATAQAGAAALSDFSATNAVVEDALWTMELKDVPWASCNYSQPIVSLLPAGDEGSSMEHHSPLENNKHVGHMNHDGVDTEAATHQFTPHTERVVDGHQSQFGSQEYVRSQAQTQVSLQIQAHAQRVSTPQPQPADDISVAPRRSTWGTHGSLYDGNGYGDESSSKLSRPSTSSTLSGKTTVVISNPVYAAEASMPTVMKIRTHKLSSFDEDSPAIAKEYETLGGVIRAYAAYEKKNASGNSEDAVEVMIANIQEVTKKLADHSLSA